MTFRCAPPSRRALLGLVMVLVGVVLIYFLFYLFNASASMFVNAFSNAPWQLYAVLIAIVALNNLVGALKWRVAIRWLEPSAKPPSILVSFEMTLFGAIFGQFIPVQISTAAIRWATASRVAGSRIWSVRSTLYEQVFDLFVMLAGCLAGILVFTAALNTSAAVLVLAVAVTLSFFLVRPFFALGAVISAYLGRTELLGRFARPLDLFADALDRAATAPKRTTLVLLSYSVVRLILLVFRALAIALVFAPHANMVLVAAGFPIAILAMMIPVAPAGLGVAEWTWSGLLILAGAGPATAAIASLALRVMNLIALCAVAIAFIPLRVLGIQRMT